MAIEVFNTELSTVTKGITSIGSFFQTIHSNSALMNLIELGKMPVTYS